MSLRICVNKNIRFALVLALVVLTFGCAAEKIAEKKEPFDKWRELAERSKPGSPVQRERTIDARKEKRDIPVEKPAPVPERPLPTDKVTLRIVNEDISVLLRALARIAHQNIMANANVKGKIDINVRKAPWGQVFRGALATMGLTYTWAGDIIRVMTLEDMDQDWKLEKKRVETRELNIKKKALEPLVTKIIYIDYSDSTQLEELSNNLQNLLSKPGVADRPAGETGLVSFEGKPSVSVDKRNNALIINAMKDDIPKLIELVQMLDRPTAQVLIEACIVETSGDMARQLGIQWGGLYHSSGDSNFWVTPGASSGLGQSLSTALDPATGMAFTAPASMIPSSGLNIGFLSQALGKYVLDVQLSALEKEGKLNILSSPSITTLDNEKAIIESGEKIPIVSIITAGQTSEEEPIYKEATLKLEVTPHVIDGKMLTLKIKAYKDEFDFSREVRGYPVMITKKAETNLVLFDGQTTVIGGLSKERSYKTNAGIPWIRNIPLIGYLFGSEAKEHKTEEILIFITPHILKAQEVGRYMEPPGH